MVNEAMRRIWTDCASGWVTNDRIFDRVYAPATAAIMTHAAVTPGSRVLDIGCGTGTLLVAAVADGASATGVDISPAMTEAAAARVPSATVVLADAQTEDLSGLDGAPFDRVVSRFGVMFFDDPVRAFTNIRGACADGARLAFACWRTAAENPTFTLGTSVLTARMTEPPAAPTPGTPGPTAYADPGYIREFLGEAGWSDVAVEPLDFECVHGAGEGGSGDDGVDERLALILGTTTGQAAAAHLEPRLGPDGWANLLDEVRAELRNHIVDGHVRHAAACWLVTAQAR